MTTQLIERALEDMPRASGPTKILNIHYNTEGQVVDIRETAVDHTSLREVDLPYEPFRALTEVKANGHTHKVNLLENLLVNPDAANILRTDVRMLAFSAFAANPRTFEPFTDMVASNMPQEEYLRDAAIGILPPARSGTEAPFVQSTFEGGTIIRNTLYRARARVLGDWLRFDQIGKIRQVAQELGLAGRMTEEYQVYNAITTAGNYTRNSTTSDNDIGANTAATTFDADGLRLAMNTISTSKDRKSGAYLGYNANTIISGPRLVVPVLQLIRSGQLQRTHGSTTVEAIGTGTDNPFAGLISRYIVSPWFGASFQWALCDSSRASFKFQTVEPFNVFQQTQNVQSEDWLVNDALQYLVRGYFGVGHTDDRAWYYSSSTTDATVS